ncbi:MAG TPA: hypothetical protein VHY09_15265 [Candidatus Methylacidiphilales bacterium]|jgi:hypothetical protein|nr:hypothetical protein [Candidatus Methylacidiphilales bacterium]
MNTTPEQAWNDAYDRLLLYLRTFDLADHAHVSRVALGILEQAKEAYARDNSREPTALTLGLAQQKIAEWLAFNLPQADLSRSNLLSAGCIAILLSRAYRTAPGSFLTTPVPEEMRQALRESLISTGPDLNVSSMTPRHLDYGPMLQFARQTWHRIDLKELFVAVAFWLAVFVIFHWWLSQVL